jgi:serine/threonine-protein kinase
MHLELEERVAIKLLLARALEDPEVVERFAREARAAVKIKSEHVAHVLDVGKLPNGAPFMVMEYLNGADLAAVIRRRGALSFAETSEYVLQACEAIAEAHALGIVHRDLKPANLFLTQRSDGLDAVKVLDFGISKMPAGDSAARSGMGLTGKLSTMGSPLYMSPEQMSSARDVDLRTDIWALGVILYECVTGRPPFEAETIPQLCAQILQQSPPPMSDVRPDAPAGFEQVVLRCLQKKRSKRYANVGELAVDLIPFAHKRARRSVERIARIVESTGSVRIEVPPSLPPEEGVREDSPTTIMPGPLYRLAMRRKPLVLGLALVSAIVLGLGVWWLMPTKAPETEIAQQHARVVAPDPAPLAPTVVAASAPPASASRPAPSALPARAAKRMQAATGIPHRAPRSKKAASSADDDLWGSRR